MVDYMKNMLIGLFVVAACALIVGIILFLEPSVGDGKETLVVRFSNINGLSLGTRVMFAGKPVGEVVAIEQIKQAREQPTDELGQVYFYQFILHVDSSVHVYNTDQIIVQTSGLLGEKSIAIIPRSPPKGVKPILITASTVVYAESIDPLESAFNELSQLSDKIEETLDRVTAWIDQNGQELGASIQSFDDAMNETSIAFAQLNKSNLIGEVKSGIQDFSAAMREVHYALDQMNADDLFNNLGITMRNTRNASYSFKQLMDNVALGKGTIGKLFVDDDTYLRVTAILSKLDTMMNDVNHYGFLFNLNKEWQRTRLKQATILNALNTPQNFRDYFNKEVDLINTAMSRLSMLVDRAENSPEREKIFEKNLFRKDFAELLRRSQALYDNLKLYNEQLMEAEQVAQ
ncbi:MAG: MlaD family protein [Candidatus Neptunochlamydia sp.]|nr:MlaD family protein [Candidatus Neptunochlamydia sp.]